MSSGDGTRYVWRSNLLTLSAYGLLSPSQLKFVWVAYYRLLQVYSSLLDEAIQLREHQVHRDLAISEMFPQVMERVTS